jgi:SAM-dependent methyltransferase
MKINLGSGGQPREGYVNVDSNPKSPKVSVVHDLDAYPWPFESDCADEVYISHCLEHLADRNRAMKEIHRILKPGGVLHALVPHFTWQFAYADPTHRHFFAHGTFFYYARECGYFDFKFSSCRVHLTFGKTLSFWNIALEPLFNLFPNVYEQSPLRMFPAVEIDAVLTK